MKRAATVGLLLMCLFAVGCGGPAEAQLPASEFEAQQITTGIPVEPIVVAPLWEPTADTVVSIPIHEPAVPAAKLAAQLLPNDEEMMQAFREGVQQGLDSAPSWQRPGDEFIEQLTQAARKRLPELKRAMAKVVTETYTYDELTVMTEFYAEHPGLRSKEVELGTKLGVVGSQWGRDVADDLRY